MPYRNIGQERVIKYIGWVTIKGHKVFIGENDETVPKEFRVDNGVYELITEGKRKGYYYSKTSPALFENFAELQQYKMEISADARRMDKWFNDNPGQEFISNSSALYDKLDAIYRKESRRVDNMIEHYKYAYKPNSVADKRIYTQRVKALEQALKMLSDNYNIE